MNKELKRTRGKRLDWAIFKTKEFWTYVDEYAEYVKTYQQYIDHYINVDVIRNPKLSWKVQKYLEEEHGLNPIPVVHFGTHERWLVKYLEAGYKYIGLGGRVGKIPYFPWSDKMWNIICNTPNRIPAVKVHGFSVTTHKHMTRYPWYSVDSVTSKKMAYYGQILVPPMESGDFSHRKSNMVIFIDSISPYTSRKGNAKGRHFMHLSKTGRLSIRKWLDYIGVPFGIRNSEGEIIQLGVNNCIGVRVEATIKYFEWLRNNLPEWPWAFEVLERPTLLEALK